MVVVVGTGIADKGEMLALVNRRVVEAEGVELMLVSNGFVDCQGLQVVTKGEGEQSGVVAGRTVIPNFQMVGRRN